MRVDGAAVDLAGCRAVVTGGAGLVGSTIVDELVRRGAEHVVVLDDLSRGRPEHLRWAMEHGAVELVVGDITDVPTVAGAVRGADVVFHQAALRITRCAAEPRRALEVLVDGTFNVVEAAAEAGVRKVVAASSASVYGMAETFPTPEHQHPYANRTLYGAAKVFAEGLLRSFHDMHGLDYVALRYFNVYGPRMDAEGVYTEVLIRWMERLAAGQPALVFGDGSQTMDFVFVADVARANVLAAAAPVTDVALNVGSGVETSLQQLAVALAGAMGVPARLQHGPERAVNGVVRRLADTSGAREAIGFEATTPLAEGLGRLHQWWLERRAEGRVA